MEKLKTDQYIKQYYLYIDYPGQMDEFMKLSGDEQADVFTKVIQPAAKREGFSFVYPVLFDEWDATKHFTSKGGEYQGASLFEVIQQAVESSDSTAPPAYVAEHWEREFAEIEKQIQEKGPLYGRGEDPYENQRILDRHSCILPGDREPFDVEYRRTRALIDSLEKRYGVRSLAEPRSRLSELGKRVRARATASGPPRRAEAMSDYRDVAALRRSVAMRNPLLDFDKLLFVGRGNYYGDDPTGQHQLSGPLAFCNRVGGGLYVVKNFKTNAEVVDLLEDSVVENGSYQGWKLSGKGSFYSPELSYDGRTVLFSWSENRIGCERAGWGLGTVGPIHRWPPENVWHVFKVNIDGSGLTQLTEGPWNDFDPCFLPSGRIVFVSERRGGYIRCFRETLYMEPTTYVMYSMKDDGSDRQTL